MTIRKRQPRRRRSLLPGSGGVDGRAKRKGRFWRSLLYANLIVVGVVVLTAIMQGQSPPFFEVVSTIGQILIWATPISVLAYLGSRYVDGRFTDRSSTVRMIMKVVVWMISGAVGSIIAVGLTHLFHLDHAPALAEMMPVVLFNGAVAIIIGAVISTAEWVGVRFKRTRTLLSQNDLLTAEFQAARSVQRSLMPDEEARIFGFDISGVTIPAVEIGGDYYDYLSFADGTKGIVVADAVGKGIPAALLMAKFQGMAQALSIHAAGPLEFFGALNDTLRARLDRHMFITVGMVTIDFDDRCTFFRAGHNPAFLYSAASGRVGVCHSSGMALGLANGALFRETLDPGNFVMESGDIALLYSDGLSEAMNARNEEYGEERIVASLKSAADRGESAQGIRAALLADLYSFVGDVEAHDDVTVVVIKKL